MKTYAFHITFANGSNPYYHFPCDYKSHIAAIRKWKRHWNLEVVSRFDGLTNFRATEKQPITPQVDLFRI